MTRPSTTTPSPAPHKARKKPVVIEYMQFDATWENIQAIVNWINSYNTGFDPYDSSTWTVSSYYGELLIKTLEGAGEMTVVKGDYVIKGVKNEFYPCKPDIFEATYDKEN